MNFSSFEIGKTEKQKKYAAINEDNRENHPRNNQAQDTSFPKIQEDYITQVSEERKGRLTKKLCQEFSRTENRTLGASSKLDETLLSPQAWGDIPKLKWSKAGNK